MKIIIGLGKTGISCARFLLEQGVRVAIMDTRQSPPNLTDFKQQYPNIPLTLGGLDQALLLQADEIIVSPGLSIEQPELAQCKEKGIPLIGDIELFARLVQAPVVAITGSNGKSTVTSLLGEMAKTAGKKVAVGGNLGQPVLDLLNKNSELFVLELSSFQLETTFSLNPLAATILNITPDHLDRHKTLENYVAAKQRVYTNAKHIVYNRDDELTKPTVFNKVMTFTEHAPESEDEYGLRVDNKKIYLAKGEKCLLDVESLNIVGHHNYLNALSALALGEAIGLELSPMLKALQCFNGLPHRCEKVAEHQGVTWYNDSKATNVGAAVASIKSIGAAYKNKMIVIAGGQAKDSDFKALRESLSQYVDYLILTGESATLIQKDVGESVETVIVSDLAQAVALAKTKMKPNSAVLLAPACASFDAFVDYIERGKYYTQLVTKIVDE